jgi:class 3 adenylate cyclase
MPATPWLQGLTGEIDILYLAQAALQGVAMTVVGPAQSVEPATLDLNFFRPIRATTGNVLARARVLNASRFYIYTEVQIEDPRGRQILHAVSHARIVPILPEPPPAPAELPRVEEPVYPTPDPHARSCSSNLPDASSFESGEIMAIYRGLADGSLKVPHNELTGLTADLTEIGSCRAQMRASEWFCLFNRNVAPGAIASLIAWAATRAGQSHWEKGFSFVGLSQSVRFAHPVPADGRMIRAESVAAMRYQNSTVNTKVDQAFDADGIVMATIQSLGTYVDSAQRQRAVAAPAKRMLCTLLFTDIVGSTQHAERLGDQKWHALLDEQRKKIRAEISRCHGAEIDTAGDGFFVRFDSPAEALECAIAAREAVKPLGIEIRAGVHTGECEVTGRNVAGMAVHIGARIQAAAGPSEIFVSSTVKDLVMGSGRTFIDRGEHELKGVPGVWRLYALA